MRFTASLLAWCAERSRRRDRLIALIAPFALLAAAQSSAQVEVERRASGVEMRTDDLTGQLQSQPPVIDEQITVQGQVDERSVWYHLHRNDLEMMRLEIERLQRAHPGWRPTGDLATAIDDRMRERAETERLAQEEAAASRASAPTVRDRAVAERSLATQRDARYQRLLAWITNKEATERPTDDQLRWLAAEVLRREDGGAAIALGWHAVESEEAAAALRWFDYGARWRHAVSARSGRASAFAVLARQALLEQRDLQAGLAALRASRAAGAEPDPAEALAWALHDRQDWTLAASVFRIVSDAEVAAFGGALVARAAGDPAAARVLACEARSRSARLDEVCVSLLEASLLAAWNSEDYRETLDWGQRMAARGALKPGIEALLAWSELRSGDVARAAERFERLLGSEVEADILPGLIESFNQSGQSGRLNPLAQRYPRLASVLDQARGKQAWARGQYDLHERLTPQTQRTGREHWAVSSGLRQGFKRGGAGLDRLDRSEVQLGLAGMVAETRLELGLRGVDLNAGRARPDAALGLRGVGGSGGAAAETSQPLASQDLAELVLLARREWADYDLELGVGTGPRDAIVSTRMAYRLGGRLYHELGSIQAVLSRQARTDSMLSFAGARDPVTGLAWGGVSETRFRLQSYRTLGSDQGLALALEHARLSGVQVAANHRSKVRIDLSQAYRVDNWAHVRAGPFVSFEHYRRNLSHYTVGHGGYYSPQRDLRFGLQFDALSVERRSGLLQLQGSLAYVNAFEQAAGRFPIGESMEGVGYQAARTRGIAGDLQIRAGWLFGDSTLVSAHAGVASAPGYDQWFAGIRLEVAFGLRRGLVSPDLATVFDRFSD